MTTQSGTRRLTREQMRRCLEGIRAGFDNAEIVYQRENRVVLRWQDPHLGTPLIIKMWSRPELLGTLRRLLRITSGHYEWRALLRLGRLSMAVPQPLGFCRVTPAIGGYTDALFTADLGRCQSATCYLKRLIRTGQESRVVELEDLLITMTRQLLDAGILDVDHGLVNTVVKASGTLVRLDFELARHVIWPALFPTMYGHMLGRLILLHAFAVQPHTDRTTRFAHRLWERLGPPQRVLARTSVYVHKFIREQFENTGIDTELVLPWDMPRPVVDAFSAGAAHGRHANLRVLITAEHVSFQFGGEGSLALHYFRVLRNRGIETWLVTNERSKWELEILFPNDLERMYFVPDTRWQRAILRMSSFLPDRVADFSLRFLLRIISQVIQRKIIRAIVKEKRISVVHQPMPVSPKEPSLIFGLGAPVLIGPMNGGMDYPPGFQHLQSRLERISLGLGRRMSHVLNRLMPGKRAARMLLVANERTRVALPKGVCPHVIQLVENAVDLSLWQPTERLATHLNEVTRFVFLGRLVDWKAVDLLLVAFKRASARAVMSLTIVGDGPERVRLEKLARDLDIEPTADADAGKTSFRGWLSQQACVQRLRAADALILPSLMECGGAVVLEAMAMRLPVIATAWGGPADYLDASCGMLVEPTSRETFIEGLSSAMVRLAGSPSVQQSMGKAGREKVEREFDWEKKVDRILEIYAEVSATSQTDNALYRKTLRFFQATRDP